MKHFVPSEFNGWYDKIHGDLLTRLDELRDRHKSPIRISKTDGAVGRYGSPTNASLHNFNRWGCVKAVDIFPDDIGYDYGKALEFYYLAKDVGITGIGIYLFFYPSIMFHIDIRRYFLDWIDNSRKYPKHNYIYNYTEKFLLKNK